MAQIVFYDIVEDSPRQKIAKYLLKQGFERVQYSVFIGLLDKPTLDALLVKVKDMMDSETDKFYVLELSKEKILNMEMLGIPIDRELLSGEKDVLFFGE